MIQPKKNFFCIDRTGRPSLFPIIVLLNLIMKHNQILRPSISVFDEDIEERLLCPQKSFYKFEFIDKLT